MIEIAQLHYQYPGAESAALKGVDLNIATDSLFGLLGPNGAGKTTLLSILSGLLPAPAGAVHIDGADISNADSHWRRNISLVPQEYAFYPTLTVAENLRVFAGVQGIRGVQRAQRIDEVCQLASLQDRLEQRAASLSGGLKRRLNIAIGLLNRPRLLLLDEPTVGIDPQSRRFILEAIRDIHQQGTAIVYTSHYMEEVQFLCDRIAILDRGAVLLEDSLAQLLAAQQGEALVVELAQDLTPEQSSAMQAMGYQIVRAELHCPLQDGADIYHHLSVLQQHKVVIAGVRSDNRDLETLFLSLTHRSLRD